jgi:hypothetical protein
MIFSHRCSISSFQHRVRVGVRYHRPHFLVSVPRTSLDGTLCSVRFVLISGLALMGQMNGNGNGNNRKRGLDWISQSSNIEAGLYNAVILDL